MMEAPPKQQLSISNISISPALHHAISDILHICSTHTLGNNNNNTTTMAQVHHALQAAQRDLSSKLRLGTTRSEYRTLERIQHQLYKEYTQHIAHMLPQLNRYSDVLPYDHSRIVLQNNNNNDVSSPPPHLSSTTTTTSTTSTTTTTTALISSMASSYINASMVSNPDTQSPVQWQYIASQGPLPGTCTAFWNMVLQYKVSTIVMLTGIIENKRKKCEIYFPEERYSTLSFDNGNILVQTIDVENLSPGIIRRRVHLSQKTKINDAPGTNTQPHEVTHYHFLSWPDHGVPLSPESFLELCAYIRIENGVHYPSPIVVHCSAGIGRSGVFCSVDIALRELLAAVMSAVNATGTDFALPDTTTSGDRDTATTTSGDTKTNSSYIGFLKNITSNLSSLVPTTSIASTRKSASATTTTDVASRACKAVDIGRIVHALRTQRAGMVQTQDQFVFCYSAVLLFLESLLQCLEASS